MNELDAAATLLTKHQDYRVLRRFHVCESFGELNAARLGSLCVLDFETTGVEDSDLAIEIGAIRIEYDMDTGRLGRVQDRYSGLEDPGFALPDHIVALTGLTDQQLHGQRFSDERVQELIDKSVLVIAHNAEFDRRFGEARFGIMRDKPWACSIQDVPWADYGIASSKLEFVAYKLGYFYDAHRAIADSEVTAGMLNQVLPDGSTGLWHLLQQARLPQYRVWAVGAAYAQRGALKDRGYAWKDIPGREDKAWRIETPTPDDEIAFLRQSVFKRGGQVLLETIGSTNRFTNRRSKTELVNL